MFDMLLKNKASYAIINIDLKREFTHEIAAFSLAFQSKNLVKMKL